MNYELINVADIDKPFAEVFKALDLKTQRKALKGAVRKESNRLKKGGDGGSNVERYRQGDKRAINKKSLLSCFSRQIWAWCTGER